MLSHSYILGGTLESSSGERDRFILMMFPERVESPVSLQLLKNGATGRQTLPKTLFSLPLHNGYALAVRNYKPSGLISVNHQGQDYTIIKGTSSQI